MNATITDRVSEERWLPVVGEEHYEVSDQGRVRRKSNGRVRRPAVHPDGHAYLNLGMIDGVRKTYRVHRLVLIAFVGPPPEGMEACHNNGDALDNRLTNLRWDTHAENNRDRVRHGTAFGYIKTHCIRGHEFNTANTVISGGRRYCRLCRQINAANRKRRNS